MKDTFEVIVNFIFKGPAILVGAIAQYLGWIITTIPRAFWQGLKNGWKQYQIYNEKD
jgi:hypothetical protein